MRDLLFVMRLEVVSGRKVSFVVFWKNLDTEVAGDGVRGFCRFERLCVLEIGFSFL